LLSCLGGILRPTSGRIAFGEVGVPRRAARQRAEDLLTRGPAGVRDLIEHRDISVR
jgi:hypothetical protein